MTPRSPWRCWCARALARGIDLSVSDCEQITAWVLDQPADPLAVRWVLSAHGRNWTIAGEPIHAREVAAHLRDRHPWPDVCGCCYRAAICTYRRTTRGRWLPFCPACDQRHVAAMLAAADLWRRRGL